MCRICRRLFHRQEKEKVSFKLEKPVTKISRRLISQFYPSSRSSPPKEVRVTSQLEVGDDGYLVSRTQNHLPEPIYEEIDDLSREATGPSEMSSNEESNEVCEDWAEATYANIQPDIQLEQHEMTDPYENVASSNIYSDLE